MIISDVIQFLQGSKTEHMEELMNILEGNNFHFILP